MRRTATTSVLLASIGSFTAGCAVFQQDDSHWFGADKMAHFAGSAALAAAATDLFDHSDRPDCETMALSVGLTLSLGAAKEGYDVYGGGPFSSKDMVANLAGALTGSLLSGRCL